MRASNDLLAEFRNCHTTTPSYDSSKSDFGCLKKVLLVSARNSKSTCPLSQPQFEVMGTHFITTDPRT